MSTTGTLIAVALLWVLLIGAIQAFLATRPNIGYGLIVPAAFLLLAGYNLYKSLYVYNPCPTMAEGMIMTFGMASFGLSAAVLVVCRIVLRGRPKQD